MSLETHHFVQRMYTNERIQWRRRSWPGDTWFGHVLCSQARSTEGCSSQHKLEKLEEFLQLPADTLREIPKED